MSEIHLVRKHCLGRGAARAEIERIARRVREQYGASYQWRGDRLTFWHASASGYICLSDESFDLTIKLGWLLAPLRGPIAQRVRRKVDEALARHGQDAAAHPRPGAARPVQPTK